MRLTKQYSLLNDLATFRRGTAKWHKANDEYKALMKRREKVFPRTCTNYLIKYGKSFKEIIALLCISHPTVTKWDRQGTLERHIRLKRPTKIRKLRQG